MAIVSRVWAARLANKRTDAMSDALSVVFDTIQCVGQIHALLHCWICVNI